jgi:lipopolysaccharide transport system ATP-binding protein
MAPIIRIRELGKRYRIGKRIRYGNLRESFMSLLGAPVKTLRSLRANFDRRDSKEAHIWALRDIALDVMPGEVVGVIGSNGAGKSTLLKILSRITEPSTGRVDLYGRVGSLLEIGTGFHPELTGRENIYLSAAILGMKRVEIERKFDEIVAFAEVDKFVDTPVKHYSSGMYVRLAFAVAAHLDPEILLVDEVLAVGDAAFQRKCLGKIGEIARNGRTVLFVSHNMASVESLCDSCILLEAGRLTAKGPPPRIINAYLNSQLDVGSPCVSLIHHPGRRASGESLMRRVTLSGPNESSGRLVRMGEALSVEVEFSSISKPICPVLGVVVKASQGWRIFGVNNRFVGGYRFEAPVASGVITCTIERVPLTPGNYLIDLYLGDHYEDYDVVSEAATFEVVAADVFGTGLLPPPGIGAVFLFAAWTLTALPEDSDAR